MTTTITQIHKLSTERQQLWFKSGKAASNPFARVGLSYAEQARLDALNRKITQLWQQRRTCANPWCNCRLNEFRGHS